MEKEEDHRIPICLVTGFLGSGKTTFLKHVVAQYRGRKLVYLVNEFSAQDIDGAMVSEENPNVVAIPGGSIFCKCLVTEFIRQLSSIPEAFQDVEGVVIEASGMANPKVIDDMLRETGLDGRYVLTHILSIVDPGSFMKLRFTLPNIVAQIEASDTALVNKADLYEAAKLDETRAVLKSIQPTIRVFPCSYGNVDLDLFKLPGRARRLHGEYAKCKDPNYETIAVHPKHDICIAEFQSRLHAVEEEVYRVKGTIRSGGKALYIDYSKSGFSACEASHPHADALVLIMRGDPSVAMHSFVQWLTL